MSKNVWLYRYSVLTAMWTVFVIVAGAFVTTRGMGDAVPDWPRSFGTWFPPMRGGIFYEHGHRLAAGGAGLLVLGLAVWMSLSSVPIRLKWLGWIAFAAVALQALLGGLRVLVISHQSYQKFGMAVTGAAHADEARASFAIAHALLAQVCLCVVFAIAAMLSPRWNAMLSKPLAGRARAGFRIGIALMAMVMVQLLLGAMMRHSGSGLIIPDFPSSLGRAIPNVATLHDDALEYARKYDTAVVDRTAYGLNTLDRLTPSEMLYKVGCCYGHRVWAFTILALLLVNAYSALRASGAPPHLRSLALYLAALGIVQVCLGIFVVLSRKSVDLTVIHVAVGASILGLCMLYTLGWGALCARVRQVSPVRERAAASA